MNHQQVITVVSITLLSIFSVGMIVNLGNIAFWEDEGETVQYGKTILDFGYPSVFDGRSFILLDTNFNRKNYVRYTSPFLQFYISAAAIALFKNPANTFLMRLPFALGAMTGVWMSWFIFKKLQYSKFSLFLYSLFLSTSVQLYLYWRQARHYALQFPLALGLMYSYLNLDKRKWNILFLIFGFLFYHAYYPGFAGFYFGLVIHALIRKYLDASYRLKPLVVNTLILIAIHLPAALYLKHYGQLPNNGYFNTLAAYLMDLNYVAYFKITVISVLVVIALKRTDPAIAIKRFNLAAVKLNLKILCSAYGYSLSLFSLVTISHILLASLGAHNQRYISVLIPFAFLIVAVSWDGLINTISQKILSKSRHSGRNEMEPRNQAPPRQGDSNRFAGSLNKLEMTIMRAVSLPILVSLVLYSHPNFISHLSGFIRELRSDYYGPVEGIVNAISNVDGSKRIDPNLPKQPDILIATNFEDGAIYSYLDSQFLNSLAPTEKYRTGGRLPDWVIIRKHWGQEEYLTSFLKRENYEKIITDYCDLPYENVYLVRTHHFQTVFPCPDSKLILYRLLR